MPGKRKSRGFDDFGITLGLENVSGNLLYGVKTGLYSKNIPAGLDYSGNPQTDSLYSTKPQAYIGYSLGGGWRLAIGGGYRLAFGKSDYSGFLVDVQLISKGDVTYKGIDD